MAFQLSPGVLVTEEDRTTVIPSVATTAGGISGAFKWGPVDEVITVDTENSLIDRFGRPDDTTAGYFFTSANFLSYGNNLKVVRVVDKSIARNAVSQPSGKVTSIQIVNSPNTYSILSDISVTIDSPVGEGIPATATAILSPSAIVSSITMTDNGYGYTIGQTLPEVTISGGGGSGATGRVVFGPGGIANVYIDFSGNNYTNLANVFVQNQDETFASLVPFIEYKLKGLELVNPGSYNSYTSNTNVVFSGGLVPGGTHAVAIPVIGFTVGNVIVQSPGSGYTASSNIVFVGGNPITEYDRYINANVDQSFDYFSPVTGNLILDGLGSIIGVDITYGGTVGYRTTPNIIINRNGGTGADAVLTAELLDISGQIRAFTITNNGNGYISAPNVVVNRNSFGLSLPEVQVNANIGYGQIRDVIIVNGGIGNYDYVPNVVVNRNDPSYGGSQAESRTFTVTNSGASAYAIDGLNNPTLTLQRGGTYTFVINASGHPFWIKTAQVTGTGSAYNTGVINNGTQNGIITFTVPNDAPSTLYYICQIHSSMTGIINIIDVQPSSDNANIRIRVEGTVDSIIVTNPGSGYTSAPIVSIIEIPGDATLLRQEASAVAILGYSVIGASITNPGLGYSTVPIVKISNSANTATTANAILTFDSLVIENYDKYENSYSLGDLGYGVFAAKYPGTIGNALAASMADSASFTNWRYAPLFDSNPSTSAYVSSRGGSNDELHIVVFDRTGEITGTAGTILEKFSFLSKSRDAKNSDGSSNYYKDIIANNSKYVYVLDHPLSGVNWGQTSTVSFDTLTANITSALTAGVDGNQISVGNVLNGYNYFANDELYDVSLILMGPTTDVGTVNSAISIAENRRDAMVFVSPPYSDVVSTINQATKITEYRDELTSSSYAVLDSGWKYQYDRYNDKYRYVPLNGDTAGLAARTDYIADPWFSPAGYNRGVIKNVVKLAYSPSKTDRDTLYKKGVNPVVTFPGQGTLLFGDKTLLARPSAFDRINVRRLFIVLEKAIANASKFQLFEFNDAFTRAQFRNLVEPFLRDVQGRRGITDFRVICDETNNTAEVIDRNEFVADIFIKPSRAINFIQLNFIATRSGISFEEVGA